MARNLLGGDRIGAAMMYEVRGPGTVGRCPVCDTAFIRMVKNRGRSLVDLEGARCAATGEPTDTEGGPCP